MRAATAGGAPAIALFVWILSLGRLDFLQKHALANFYDAQAHAWFAGRWDIPRDQLGFEAFVHDGKTYTYLGPWPTMLRLPIAVFTHRFDGRLTQLSLLLGFTVLVIGTSQLLWRIRALARGCDTPCSTAERILVGAFVFTTAAGSVALFLASRPVVYHEAELWGPAWSITAFAVILDVLLRPNARAIFLAGLFSTLAVLSRGSVGFAPVVALGAIALAYALYLFGARTKRPLPWFGVRLDNVDGVSWPRFGAIVAATVVPVALYAYVNFARFGSLFHLPIDQQIATVIDPKRPGIFRTTHGSLFAAKYLPTDAVAAFRPAGIGFTAVFPWITFPERARVIGGLTYASIAPSASIPASMPLLFGLALAGAVAIFWRRSAHAPLRILVLAGCFGTVGALSLPFIDHRYYSDFLPLLVVSAGAGAYVTGAWLARRSRTVRRAVLAVIALLAAFAVCTNVALSLVYQRAYSPFTEESVRAAFVRFQHDAPGGSHVKVVRGHEMPRPAGAGTLFVVDDCAGVYWSSGEAWFPIERTAVTGRYPVELTIPKRPAGVRENLLVAGPPGDQDRIGIEYLDRGRIRYFVASDRLPEPAEGEPVTLPGGRRVRVDLVYDTRLGHAAVVQHGEELVGLAFPLVGSPVAVPGPDFSGTARRLAAPPKFCRSLVR